jgi:hypothetical protein
MVDQLARAPARRKIDEDVLAQFVQCDCGPPSGTVFRRNGDHHRRGKQRVYQQAPARRARERHEGEVQPPVA